MKLILLSDLHLVTKNPSCRKDDLFYRQFDKLKFILDYDYEEDTIILQAGDFFDKPKSVDLLSKVVQLMDEYKYPYNWIHGVFGQHDLLYRGKKDTCLKFLNDCQYYKILNDKGCKIEGNVFYGCSWGEKVPVVDYKEYFNVLVIHYPISDHKIVGLKTQGHKEFLKKHKDYDLILCGDIHKKFFYRDKDDRMICNTGPMNRKVQDLKDHSPGFWVFDTELRKEKWVEIPHEKDVFVEDRRGEKKENQRIMENFVEKFRKVEIRGVDIENKLLILLGNSVISDFTRRVLLGLIDFDKKGF